MGIIIAGLEKQAQLKYNYSMTDNEKTISLGKKIFFLHPSAFTQNQLISELAQEEFEVYVIKDEYKLLRALEEYPDSVLFASVNEVIKENAWEDLIKRIQGNPANASVDIGIIASIEEENIKKKYLEQLKVRCGYTVVKQDPEVALKQLTINLNSVDAKGRRKYIRVIMGNEANATVNFSINGNYINGTIKDLSVVGFSCSFVEDPKLTKNGLFPDIQLKLQSQLLKVEGIVFGSRMDGPEKVYVILFSQRVDPDTRSRIRKYIQTNLQNRMDQKLK